MLRTARLLHPASPPASRPTTGASLPGTLASPWTGLTPAGCRELLVRLRQTKLLTVMASELLDTRGSRLICHDALVAHFRESLGLEGGRDQLGIGPAALEVPRSVDTHVGRAVEGEVIS